MANGIVTDEEDQDLQDELDLGQDYRAPSEPVRTIQAPPVVAAPAPVIAAPGGPAPIVAPAITPLSPQDAANRAMWRRMKYATADLPIDQAEQAVTTALKFQGLRGYQKDIADGKPANEALARWAPIMFSQPKAGTLSGAASMIRAGQGPQNKIMDIGGVGYRYDDKTGTMTALTPPKAVAAPKDPTLLADYNSIRRQMDAVTKELEADPAGPGAPFLRQKLLNLQSVAEATRVQMNSPRPGVAAPSGAEARVTAPLPATPAAAPQTVTSKAQFDALPSGAIYIGRNGRRYRKP